MKTNPLKKALMVILGISVLCLVSCEKNMLEEYNQVQSNYISDSPELRSSSFKSLLVKRWAPIHHQDVDATGSHALNGKADYITAINFDGDWNATNNWNNIASETNQATAHCYYSVVETETHWFIIYAFFHPRDWANDFPFSFLDEHENDLEGVLMVVEKNSQAFGELKACVTVAHSDFYSFVPESSNYEANTEDIDGILSMQTYNGESHPVTAQECRGHGLKAYPHYKINGDGIIYYPSMSNVAEAPSGNYDNYVQYKLVDIFETNGLWEQRNNTDIFKNSGGAFKSGYGYGGANAPWNWDDKDDEPASGEFATDPAKLIKSYFSNLGSFSIQYIQNGYLEE